MAKSKQPDFPKIFPEDHWNRPPLRDRGDATADLTYGAVGMAITQWEMLEDAVADLFAVLVQGQYSIAQRVYGAITTSHVRREALRNAAEIVFRNIAASEEERNTFAQLLDNFSRASARRDDIAHAIVMGFQLSREPNAPMEDLGCFLLPPRYNSERNHPL